MKKVKLETVNGTPTVKKCYDSQTVKVYESTGFNYGIHEEKDGQGTLTVSFDSKLDAEKFVNLYNQL